MDWNRGKDPSDKSYVSPLAERSQDAERTEYWFRIEICEEDGRWYRSALYPELYREAGAWNRAEELRNGFGRWNVRVVVDSPVLKDPALQEYTVRVTYTVMATSFDDAKLRYRSGTYVQTDVTKKES